MRSKLKSMIPRALLVSSKATKRLVNEFAERSGLVYFGYVSQRKDEHHIVRGMTVSNQHVDDHYCIGTYEDYEVMFVERSDKTITNKHHTWHIMEFDLKTDRDIPHLFIGSDRHGFGFHSLLATKYVHLLPAQLENSGYPTEFTSNFKLYVIPAQATMAEQLFPLETAKIVGEHFKGLVIEVTEQSLYIYSEKSHLSAGLLDTMLKNGTWLARQIDEQSKGL